MADIVLGDGKTRVANLTVNGATFNIPTDSTVKVAIVSKDKKVPLTTEPVTASSATVGADWTKSKVAFKFPRNSTSGITAVGAAFLEVQVTISDEDSTWHLPVKLVPATIA